MNELQQVLLVFAVVVIAVLYFLSKKRQNNLPKQETHSKTSSGDSTHSKSAYNEPSKQHNEHQSSQSTPLNSSETKLADEVPDNQTSLPFDDGFQASQAPHSKAVTEPNVSVDEIEKVEMETPKTSNHHVLEVEELLSVSEVGQTVDDLPKPNFGIPEEKGPAASQTPSKRQREHQVFVLMVLNTGGSGQEFTMDAVNQALLGVGLRFSKNHIYVTTDAQGTEIIRVANIMEPGTFPTENLQSHTTPGLALILELPTSVRAPAAMHDLIIMARKVSQRLNSRLYNMERHLIKESDLQAMRDAAVAYESDPL